MDDQLVRALVEDVLKEKLGAMTGQMTSETTPAKVDEETTVVHKPVQPMVPREPASSSQPVRIYIHLFITF